jgi:hypothetical protein
VSDLPLYSDIELIHDSGRQSSSDAPEETGGTDNFRREFLQESKGRSAGAFGRSPEVQRDEPAQQEPIDYDHINATIAENLELRERVQGAELEAEWANDSRLDERAYAAYETREDYEDAADELLAAGGGDRLFALTQHWSERDPDGAAQWVAQAEYEATIATAEASQRAMQAEQGAVTSAYAKQLADFYEANPGYQTGTTKHWMLAQALAGDPSIGASPQSFRDGLAAAHEVVEDVSNAALRTANTAAFKDEFRQLAARQSMFSHGAEVRAYAAAANPAGPNNAEALTAAIVARQRGTGAQRQAALRARDAEFRQSFSQAARGSGFGEGAREQAAKALEAREEERAGKRPPNRGV